MTDTTAADTTAATNVEQATTTQAPAATALAPEQTADVTAAKDEQEQPKDDPLQPLLDAIAAQGQLINDLVDNVNNLGERVAQVEKDADAARAAVEGLKTSDGMAAIVKGAVEAALKSVGDDVVGTIKADIAKIKAKLHHM